jgi:hypothetical protein
MKWMWSTAKEGIAQGAAWFVAFLLLVWLWGRTRDNVAIPL